MEATRFGAGRSLSRVLLLALFAAIAWFALTLFASASSASAADGDTQNSGLLGVVGSTVSDVGGVATGATGTVEPVVQTVATVVTPAATVIPEPVAQPVAEVTQSVTHVAEQTVSHADTAVSTVVDTATTVVADTAASGAVGSLVEPIVGLAEGLPVVGGVVEQTGLGSVLTDTATGLDGTVEIVVGSAAPVGSVVPALPVSGVDVIVDALAPPGTTPRSSGTPGDPGAAVLEAGVPSLRSAVAVVLDISASPLSIAAAETRLSTDLRAGLPALDGTAASITDASPRSGVLTPLGGTLAASLGASVPSGSGAAPGGAGGPAAGLAVEGDRAHSSAFTGLRTNTDDALPGAPVFDTDISPD